MAKDLSPLIASLEDLLTSSGEGVFIRNDYQVVIVLSPRSTAFLETAIKLQRSESFLQFMNDTYDHNTWYIAKSVLEEAALQAFERKLKELSNDNNN
jgi:hypothetical protein